MKEVEAIEKLKEIPIFTSFHREVQAQEVATIEDFVNWQLGVIRRINEYYMIPFGLDPIPEWTTELTGRAGKCRIALADGDFPTEYEIALGIDFTLGDVEEYCREAEKRFQLYLADWLAPWPSHYAEVWRRTFGLILPKARRVSITLTNYSFDVGLIVEEGVVKKLVTVEYVPETSIIHGSFRTMKFDYDIRQKRTTMRFLWPLVDSYLYTGPIELPEVKPETGENFRTRLVLFALNRIEIR